MGHLDIQCQASMIEVCCRWAFTIEYFRGTHCSEVLHLQDFLCTYVVEALSQGEKGLPKYDRRREGAIKEYEESVRKMRTVQSVYVTVCFPTRPLESTSTPNTMSRNEGSQSQNPCSS